MQRGVRRLALVLTATFKTAAATAGYGARPSLEGTAECPRIHGHVHGDGHAASGLGRQPSVTGPRCTRCST